ncbi:MAG: MFS transporter [Acidobacteriaceae bacterium]
MTINGSVIGSILVGALGGLLFGFDTAVISGDLQAVAVGATNLVATLIAMTMIDRFGRKKLLLT